MAIIADKHVHTKRLAVIGGLLCLLLGGCDADSTQLGKTVIAPEVITPVVVAPTVASTAPLDLESQVAQGVEIEVTFSTDIALSSVTADTFTLHRQNTAVAATVQFDGTTATLTPDTALKPSTRYRLELSDGIVDTDGIPLTPYTWDFYTEGTGWTTEQVIEDHTAGHSQYPNISLGPNGNAVAVWLQRTGSRYDIAANHYSADTGNWGTTTLIESDDTGSANGASVAMDAEGNATALWSQYDGSLYNIYTNRFNASSGTWGGAALIEFNNTDSAYGPTVAVDRDGNAFAIWLQRDGSVVNTVANRYNNDTGTWGTPELIDTGSGGITSLPKLSVNARGDAAAVWEYYDGANFNIVANTFDASTGLWRGDAAIAVSNTQYLSEPDISIDATGNATAVWMAHDSSLVNVTANRFDASTATWGNVALIEFDDTGSAYTPRVVSTDAGDSIAIWIQVVGGNIRTKVAHFKAETGSWDLPVQLDTADPGGAYSPSIGADANGNAIALWRHSDGTLTHAVASQYSASTGTWGTAFYIESEDTNVFSPTLSVNDSGQAVAAWQFDATPYDDIAVNHFELAAAP